MTWLRLKHPLSRYCKLFLVTTLPAAQIKSRQLKNQTITATNVIHGNQTKTNTLRYFSHLWIIRWPTRETLSCKLSFTWQLILWSEHLLQPEEQIYGWGPSLGARAALDPALERHILILEGSVLTPSNPKVMIHDTKGAELNHILYRVEAAACKSGTLFLGHTESGFLIRFPEEVKYCGLFHSCHSNKTAFQCVQFTSEAWKLFPVSGNQRFRHCKWSTFFTVIQCTYI